MLMTEHPMSTAHPVCEVPSDDGRVFECIEVLNPNTHEGASS